MIAEMLSLATLDDIYTFIIENLQKQLPYTTILLVSIDEKNKKTKLEKVTGLEKYYFDKILNLIGYNPIGKTFELLPSHHSYFKSGNLVEFYGGMSIFAGPEIPVIVSAAIDKIIGLNKIYTIGINNDDQLLACVHFFVFNNQEIQNIDFIETFIKQAGIIIQKKIVVEDLKTSEIELKELNASKDKFFSIIAHDLRSPLGNFKEITKLLHESYDDFIETERIEFLGLLKNSADNIYSLLENLLEWTTSQRGTIPFNPSDINLKLLSTNTVQLLKPIAENKQIEIINLIPISLTVKADAKMLNTIIRNLISNSIKFTSNGGRIEIGIKNNKLSDNLKKSDKIPDVCIYIKDNGIGMNNQTLEKLFRIDSDVSRPGTNNESSTGLGLILCKEFVEKHNGKIWAESEEGNGSTFYFTLAKVNE
jgi:signal transduction histidine kinase